MQSVRCLSSPPCRLWVPLDDLYAGRPVPWALRAYTAATTLAWAAWEAAFGWQLWALVKAAAARLFAPGGVHAAAYGLVNDFPVELFWVRQCVLERMADHFQ